VWGELQAVSAVATGMALALIILLLAVDPAGRFGYQRPSGRTDPALIVLGIFSPVALSLVGGSIPTSDSDFGTLRFSDPMVVTSFAVLAGLVILTQGALQGGILAGWTGGASFVLANTVALRVQSDPALASILTAQLLLCSYTVAILAATAVLALRGDRWSR
jgi:hypothetical protein